MRIGLFSDTYPPDINGVANSTKILHDELKKYGHEVYVIAPRNGMGFFEWNEDHDILRLAGIELKQLYGYVLTSPLHFNALNEIRKLNLDIIHAQTEFGVGIFARICANTLEIPLVSTYHTTYEDYTHYINIVHSKMVDNYAKKAVAQLSKLYGNSSMRVIAPSEKTKELLESYHVNTGIRVVPTGLPLDKFSRKYEDKQKSKEIRQTYNIQDDEFMICYVGRIAKEKALDLVIDGFQQLPESAKCKLVIIGGGPDEQVLHDKVKQANVSNRVYFAGAKPSEEVPDYYRAADAFISASLSETQGMTFIEALASGLPLFAREDEVLKELLIPDQTGWYFKDAKDIVDKLLAFEQLSPQERERIKTNCIEKVKPYSSEVFYEKVLAVYQEAIDEYKNQYSIDEITPVNDYIQIKVHNHIEEKKLIMNMDDYYNNGIFKGGKLNQKQIEAIEADEARVRAYQKSLHRIAVKDRTEKEMRDWLSEHTDCKEAVIEEIIQKLKEKSLINDENYCESYIHSMRMSLFGKERILRDLRKKGIKEDILKEKFAQLPDEHGNAMEYAQKVISSFHHDSTRMKKRKMKTKMMQRGFSADVAEDIIADIDFQEDEQQEKENLVACIQKAKKRYQKRHQGKDLRNAIYRYCLTQGYASDKVYRVFDEMEWEDDKN